jgi:tetratricopeptide (TPR) repeat protein
MHWLALDDAQRCDVALQVMRQAPVLWIWDNVEPVAGFPTGTPSRWGMEEQREIADFLRAARETKAKFLLTSRRDERGWLGDLPARITVPPMPFQERVQLARALAEKHGRRLNEIEDWRPLLDFTQGNPMTITVLVGQALRTRLRTREQIKGFVAKLRAGEAVFEDEASEGRTRSLAASLNYGFENAFSEPERRQLALLHLFQGFVDVNSLRWMGKPERDWCLPQVRGLTRDSGIALLDRAAEVGLLTAHGGGYYSIHPALPWFFKRLFDEYYAGSERPALRAFVEAMAELGNFYHDEYVDGRGEVIAALGAEEANLLHARDLARRHGWWRRVIGTMQGLRALYEHAGRRAEWARLVEETVPDFVDPANDGPLAGLEEEWSLINGYRVLLAEQARQWAEAERLQRAVAEWDRQRASAALALPPEEWDSAQSNMIRSLAVSVHELGQIQRKTARPECVESYKEAYDLALRIKDEQDAAIAAFNLGNAYIALPVIRDLGEAERWSQRSLDLHSQGDRLGRGKGLGQLGYVAWERFEDARKAAKPEAELRDHLTTALEFYLEALDLIPHDAVNDLAVAHNQLGLIYGAAGNLEQALAHYRKSIGYQEAQGNTYGAALTRGNVAVALARRGRYADAKDYAVAALRGYEAYGEGAKENVLTTLKLIAEIDEDLKGSDEG